jgi:hypothetical protein
MAEHVVAMDPGGRSGWASAYMAPDRLELTGGGVLRQDLMTDWFGMVQGIVAVGALPHKDGVMLPSLPRTYDVLVYESWYPRPQNGSMEWIKGDELDEAQHIGALLWIARTSGTRIVTQHPSDKPQAMGTMPARLKALDYFSTEQHDQDARMHLWLYFWRNWFSAKVSPNKIELVA